MALAARAVSFAPTPTGFLSQESDDDEADQASLFQELAFTFHHAMCPDVSPLTEQPMDSLLTDKDEEDTQDEESRHICDGEITEYSNDSGQALTAPQENENKHICDGEIKTSTEYSNDSGHVTSQPEKDSLKSDIQTDKTTVTNPIESIPVTTNISVDNNPSPGNTSDTSVSDATHTNTNDKMEGTSIPKQICDVQPVPPHSMKKRPGRKERYEKKGKTRRRLNPWDFGFHLSLIPRLPPSPSVDENDENSDDKNDTTNVNNLCDENISVVGELQPQSAGSSSRDVVLESPVTCDDSQKDDQSFFADLGIDIHDSGNFGMEEDFLEWDGLTFSTPSVTVKPRKTTKSNFTKDKTRCAKGNTKHKSTSKTSDGARSKVNQDTRSKVNQDKTPSLFKGTTKLKASMVTDINHFSFPNYKITTHEQIQLFELECNSSRRIYLRRDKDRKVEKIHTAIKSSHCTIDNITNNMGRKSVCMHHRLVKKTNLVLDFRQSRRFCPPKMSGNSVDLTVAKQIRIKTPRERVPPAQNLKHVLHATNMPSAFETDLASFLLSIQNRELTPEDYEMLLRLDDSVKAKTVSKHVLDNLKTETVGEDTAAILMCVICMEPYQVGQTRKFLPCEHDFHSSCIDSWLQNSSQNCPLDGLPILDS